jgi:hypothetical protein
MTRGKPTRAERWRAAVMQYAEAVNRWTYPSAEDDRDELDERLAMAFNALRTGSLEDLEKAFRGRDTNAG